MSLGSALTAAARPADSCIASVPAQPIAAASLPRRQRFGGMKEIAAQHCYHTTVLISERAVASQPPWDYDVPRQTPTWGPAAAGGARAASRGIIQNDRASHIFDSNGRLLTASQERASPQSLVSTCKLKCCCDALRFASVRAALSPRLV